MHYNKNIYKVEVQDFIDQNIKSDPSRISLKKSPFPEISSAELASQISAKNKSEKKLPTWFKTPGIYYPSPLSIEQTSSEITASYKNSLASGKLLVDITAGFGVDAFYFSKKFEKVICVERQEYLSKICADNAKTLGAQNIETAQGDGLEFLESTSEKIDLIYVDPARRNSSGKVFKLIDCEPNIIENLDLLFDKSDTILVKTSPLLDIKAGLSELSNVKEIHIVSVRNECKELLWLLKKDYDGDALLKVVTLNEQQKEFVVKKSTKENLFAPMAVNSFSYVYEPDVALLKSGAFNEIAEYYGLSKLERDSHLYYSSKLDSSFPGRIFKLNRIISANLLKNLNDLEANVLVRNYPDTAERLVKKYKIKPSEKKFLLFTKTELEGLIILDASILQYY